MAQSNKICGFCGELGHSKSYCKTRPRTPIKSKPIDYQERYDKAIAKSKERLQPSKRKKKVISPRKKAKDAAWTAFSAYIRTRDCLRFTGDPQEGVCVTCKRPYPYKRLQAGHFIDGRGNAVLFDERIVYTQCWQCNGKPPYGLGGNYVEYFRFMLDEWGLEMIDEFRALKNTDKPYKIYQFNEIEQEYKTKVAELLSGKRG